MMKKRLAVLMACLLATVLVIQSVPVSVQATDSRTSTGLAAFAHKALQEKWGYVFATYGQVMTSSIISGKRNQYPDVYAEIMSDGRTAYDHSLEWIGKRAADCSGLYKAYAMWDSALGGPRYNATYDRSANGLYSGATVKGPIETIPDVHGLLVWRDGHLGVYVGNGEVIEARGVEYGVVKTRLGDRGWTGWCRAYGVSYITTGWVTLDGKDYYYRNGAYVKGLQSIDGGQYLFGPDGARLLGFQTVAGALRHFRADGRVLTGWQTIDGNRYHLDANGAVLTGWQTIGGNRYHFSNQGILQTGWQQLGGSVYHLGTNGTPVTGTTTIGSRIFQFDASGRLQNMPSGQLIGLSRNRAALALPVGGRQGGVFIRVPANGITAVPVYTSSNPAVATVDARGMIKALAEGSATIFARAGGFETSCLVTVSGQFPTLARGSSGDRVRSLQLSLSSLGYNTGSVDGIFGPRTEFAVMSLQQRLGLEMTGSASHSLQIRLISGQARSATSIRTAGRLQPGDTGEQVHALQQRLLELNLLKALPTGNFASLTTQAIKTLQTLNGLPVTGIAGTAELGLICSPRVAAGRVYLELGHSGYEVLLLQQRLAELGYYAGHLDGTYGSALESAVRMFQSTARLTIDGVAGQLTQQRLFAAGAPASQDPAVPPPPGSAPVYQKPVLSAPLKLGSRGEDVRTVQLRLSQLGYDCGTADGIFGVLTDNAVRKFQTRARLTVDGIVGNITLNALFSNTAPRAA